MRPDVMLPSLLAAGSMVFGLWLAGCTEVPPHSVISVAGAADPPPHPARRAADLLGDSAADLTARFGPPSLRHRDGPAEVWLYAGNGCRLDLVLYRPPAEATGGVRVSHAAVRSAVPAGEDACLRDLASEEGD